MADTLDPRMYDDYLRVEAAGKLPPAMQQDLDTIRAANLAPPIPSWTADHPHIQEAEAAQQLPKGFMAGLLSVENATGATDATSPTKVKGLFQVTTDTGAPYGLTHTNRTNPYLNTDVATKVAKSLLDQTGGDIPAALNLYKGHGPQDASNEKYLAKFAKGYLAAGGDPGLLNGQGATAIAVHQPSEVPEPSVGTSTTTTPATQTVGQEIRERAGFGTPGAPQPTVGNGLFSAIGRGAEKLNAALGGVPGQTAENLGTGPIGPLLKLLELPAATVGTGVNRAAGSPTAGTAAQIATDLLGPKLLAEGGSRLLGAVLPENAARTLVPRAAARNDLATANRTTSQLESQLTNATQEAAAATDRAAQLGAHADLAGAAPPTTPGRAPLPPTLNALTPEARNAADSVMQAGIASQKDTGKALAQWRVAKSKLFDAVEQLAGDAPVVDAGDFRNVMQQHGMAEVTEDGLKTLTTGLGLTPKGKEILGRAFEGPLSFADARTLQGELGNAAFKAPGVTGTPMQGIAKQLYAGLSRGVDEFLTSPAGSDVAPALAEAKQAYKNGKILFNDGARRLVMGTRNAPKAAESVVSSVFKPGNISDTLDYKQLVSDDTYAGAVQSWLRQRIATAGGPQATMESLHKAFQPYLDNGHLEVILPPDAARTLRTELAQGLQASQTATAAAPTTNAATLQLAAKAARTSAQDETRRATGLEKQIGQLGRQTAQASKVLAAPTVTRRLLRAGKAVVKPIAYGAGVGAGGAAAYRAFNSK